LKGQIQDYGLQDKIILKGNVDNVNEFLQAANFFIMPSLWEGFSVALLEAAWAGKVIIATDVGGNTEIINDSETGFLVDSEDAKRLAGKIDYVFTLTSDKIDSIGRRAKERVGDEFSIQKMVDNHEELYE
jgi:glycosyltransferase involved in cell wall biosynthesis